MYENKIYYNLKFDPRPEQIDALNFIKENIRIGNKNFLLNLPTGVGKSYFVIMFINWYLEHINDHAKFDIITNSKILQKQYTDEYPYIASLKGKQNYTCERFSCSCKEGLELCSSLKKRCESCPYKNAFANFLSSRVSITNFTLMNAFHLYLPSLLKNKNNVLIIDEAHGYESALSDQISIKISQQSLKFLGFNESWITQIYNELKNIINTEDFFNFLQNKYVFYLQNYKEELENKIQNSSKNHELIKNSRFISSINNEFETISIFLNDMKEDYNNIDNWIYENNEEYNNKIKIQTFSVSPIWSRKFLDRMIFQKYDHIIFMSGTILNKDIFSYLNGLEDEITCYHSIDSPFPIKNRPIFYIKTGKMTYEHKKESWERQKLIIEKIIKRNINHKGIIHTANYELSNWVKEYFQKDSRFLFYNSDDRDRVLAEHIRSDKPTIIVGPFTYFWCRFI